MIDSMIDSTSVSSAKTRYDVSLSLVHFFVNNDRKIFDRRSSNLRRSCHVQGSLRYALRTLFKVLNLAVCNRFLIYHAVVAAPAGIYAYIRGRYQDEAAGEGREVRRKAKSGKPRGRMRGDLASFSLVHERLLHLPAADLAPFFP